MHIDAGQLGKYELRERLGQGGMAEVWKAFDARLQRFVAIKFLHAVLRSDPTFYSEWSGLYSAEFAKGRPWNG